MDCSRVGKPFDLFVYSPDGITKNIEYPNALQKAGLKEKHFISLSGEQNRGPQFIIKTLLQM